MTPQEDARIRELAPKHNKRQIAELMGLGYNTILAYTQKHKIICKEHKNKGVNPHLNRKVGFEWVW